MTAILSNFSMHAFGAEFTLNAIRPSIVKIQIELWVIIFLIKRSVADRRIY